VKKKIVTKKNSGKRVWLWVELKKKWKKKVKKKIVEKGAGYGLN
jgi:hypothetical protein